MLQCCPRILSAAAQDEPTVRLRAGQRRKPDVLGRPVLVGWSRNDLHSCIAELIAGAIPSEVVIHLSHARDRRPIDTGSP